jgi:hypothetical protein
MKEFSKLREVKAEQLVYDVKWADQIEKRVTASSIAEAVKMAKTAILKNSPELAHSKHAAIWKESPFVQNIDENTDLEEISSSALTDKITSSGLGSTRKAMKPDKIRKEIDELKKRLAILTRSLKNESLSKNALKLDENAGEETSMIKRQLTYIKLATQDITDYISECGEYSVNPEEWFQNKIANIHGQIGDLHSYALAEMENTEEDDEDLSNDQKADIYDYERDNYESF